MPDRTVVMLDTSWNSHEGGHATGFGISLMTYGREERRITPLKRIAVLVFLASGGWNLHLGVLAAPEGEIDALRCWAGAVCVLVAILIVHAQRRPSRH